MKTLNELDNCDEFSFSLERLTHPGEFAILIADEERARPLTQSIVQT